MSCLCVLYLLTVILCNCLQVQLYFIHLPCPKMFVFPDSGLVHHSTSFSTEREKKHATKCFFCGCPQLQISATTIENTSDKTENIFEKGNCLHEALLIT